jgi:hypothetical protein
MVVTDDDDGDDDDLDIVITKEQYLRDVIVWGQVHFNMCKEIGVELDNEQWCAHVRKLVETGPEGKS